MKIDFTEHNLDEFIVNHGVFCGMPATLVIPNHIGTKFTQHNSIFRSSIWDLDGNLISASFKKFVNWGENPDNFPTPESLNKTTIVEKIDGSAVIIDYVNSVLSMRTRGTFSVITMENAVDFELCLNKYPKISEWLKNNSNYSLIAEITTPNLRIVIRYGDEPDFCLTGAINKDDYSLMTQTELDKLAGELGMARPDTYSFNDISDLLFNIDSWQQKEGVCVYSNNGQTIHKVKSTWYLKLHAFKSEASFENTIDLFFAYDMPLYQDFEKKLIDQFDYECFQMVRGFASTICEGYKEVQKIVSSMVKFADSLKSLPNRKEQALKVFSSYGKESNRSSFVFAILDGKSLSKEQQKKLLYQVTKN